jgi:hypothetical protein
MLDHLLKASIGIALLLGAWLAVLCAWRRVFPGTSPGDDVLAGRTVCRGLGHRCSCQPDGPDHSTGDGRIH